MSKVFFKVSLTCIFSLVFLTNSLYAQTDLNISGAKSGFPIAIPQLCNQGDADPFQKKLSASISKNLKISGIFRLLNVNTFIETPAKCLNNDKVVYSDWSVIGAEALVRGRVKRKKGILKDTLEVYLYLHDVVQKRPVLGKRYEGDVEDFKQIADRFSNEIIKYFTGEEGIFGTKIAYVSKVGRFKEVFVMDIDGGNVKQLTHDHGLAVSPAWSPDSKQIIYTSYRSRRPDLYVIPSEGGSPSRFTERPGLELGAEYSPVSNEIIASATIKGLTNLVLFDLRGKFLRKVTRSSSIDVSPAWSPDGRKIAFCSNRGGGPQVYLMNQDGTNMHRISFTGSPYCTSPAFSPKGDKIAFVCRDRGNQVYISDISKGKTIQLTFSGNNEEPSWSPDGRFLAMSSNLGRGGARNIVIYSLLGNTTTQITFSKSEDSMPSWSFRRR